MIKAFFFVCFVIFILILIGAIVLQLDSLGSPLDSNQTQPEIPKENHMPGEH